MNLDEIWEYLNSLGPVVLSILFPLLAVFLVLVFFIAPIRWLIRYNASSRRLREMWDFLEKTRVEGHRAAADPARAEAAKRAANAIMAEHDRLFRRWPGFLFFPFRRKMERYPLRERYSGPSIPPKLAGFSKKTEPDAWMRQLFDTQIVHQLSPVEQMRKGLRAKTVFPKLPGNSHGRPGI